MERHRVTYLVLLAGLLLLVHPAAMVLADLKVVPLIALFSSDSAKRMAYISYTTSPLSSSCVPNPLRPEDFSQQIAENGPSQI